MKCRKSSLKPYSTIGFVGHTNENKLNMKYHNSLGTLTIIRLNLSRERNKNTSREKPKTSIIFYISQNYLFVQKIFCFVNFGRNVGGASSVRMIQQHHLLVKLSNFLRLKKKIKSSIRFLISDKLLQSFFFQTNVFIDHTLMLIGYV
jgi:hypothetical protein